ncbi:MAG TPA: hypothetical protein VIM86_07405 [Thermodesulfobacteriota bacterium]
MHVIKVGRGAAALAIAAMVLFGAAVGEVHGADGATLTDSDLRALATAHALIEEKAIEVYPKVEASGDPARDITGADRRAVERALEGSGVSFDHFARVQRELMKSPEALPRFFQLEQQLKAERRKGK